MRRFMVVFPVMAKGEQLLHIRVFPRLCSKFHFSWRSFLVFFYNLNSYLYFRKNFFSFTLLCRLLEIQCFLSFESSKSCMSHCHVSDWWVSVRYILVIRFHLTHLTSFITLVHRQACNQRLLDIRIPDTKTTKWHNWWHGGRNLSDTPLSHMYMTLSSLLKNFTIDCSWGSNGIMYDASNMRSFKGRASYL